MKRLDDYTTLRADSPGMIAPVGSVAPVDSEEMSIALARIPAGGEPVAPHLHRESTETYVVVRGQGLLVVNGETSTVGPGAVVLMEPGDVHSIAQTGEDVLEFWAVSTPPWRPEDEIAAGDAGDIGTIGDAEAIAAALDMQPVPVEGGRFAQSWLDENSSGIFYLMTGDDTSGLHALSSMELWSFHAGSPVSMLLLYPDGRTEEPVLGPDVTAGQRPQVVVPPGVQMAAEPTDGWSLVGTFMTPPYAASTVHFGVAEELVASHPTAAARIRRLARY